MDIQSIVSNAPAILAVLVGIGFLLFFGVSGILAIISFFVLLAMGFNFWLALGIGFLVLYVVNYVTGV